MHLKLTFAISSEYAALSRLRMFWPEVPVLTLSATMGPHVAKYVHKSLEMTQPTRLIKRCIDRSNIYFHRVAIRNASVFSDLDWLVPKNVDDSHIIPKTMVFIDSLPGACAMVDHLIALLKKEWKGEMAPHRDLICDFSTALSMERREQILESFRDGNNRLLVCTEACGMGLDIGDVVRVIQWKATKLLNLATFFQRAGRAGRSGANQTVAILYHQESLGNLEGNYEVFRSDIDGPRGPELLSSIRKFDFGSDDAAAIRRGKSSTKNILKNQGIQMRTQIEHVADDTEGPDARKVICRGILSYIGTKGCMRSILLKYFDSSFHADRLTSRCCYSCTVTSNQELDSEIQKLLPTDNPDGCDADRGADRDGDADGLQPSGAHTQQHTQHNGTLIRYKNTTLEHTLAVTVALRDLRDNILRSQWPQDDESKSSVAPASFFLSDKEITRIAKSAHLVNNQQQLAKRLIQKSNYQWAPIAAYATDVLEHIAQAMDSIKLPVDAPAAPRNRRPRQKSTLTFQRSTLAEQSSSARNTLMPPPPNPPPNPPPHYVLLESPQPHPPTLHSNQNSTWNVVSPTLNTTATPPIPIHTLPPSNLTEQPPQTVQPLNPQLPPTRATRQKKVFDNAIAEAKHQESLRKRRERYARNKLRDPLHPQNNSAQVTTRSPLAAINPAQVQNMQSMPQFSHQTPSCTPTKKRHAEELSPTNSKRLKTTSSDCMSLAQSPS